MPPTFIAPERKVTDRVVLRSWMPGEGPLLAEALRGSYDHLKTWMPFAEPGEPDPAEKELLIREFRARWLLAENFVMPIFDAMEQRVLGGTGFHLRQGPLGSGNIEVGMWIRADEAGRGLGGHVLGAMVEWAWDEWGFRRIVWTCDEENVPSRRTAERHGFQLEGIGRLDSVRPDGTPRSTCTYALLKDA